MSHTPSLFDLEPPLAYIRSSETSKAAAEQAVVFAPSQRARLLDHYVRCGSCGSTDREAHRVLGIERGTICLRRRELMKAGRVELSGDARDGCGVYKAVTT